VVVLSGKGGVGKSTVAAQMAWALSSRGLRVGLLDLDICGPSIPHLLGLRGQRVGQSREQKMSPVRVSQEGLHLDVMSIGFLLDSEQEPVVLRAHARTAWSSSS
jgi:Mrp family chromosome partitioning ATPase